MKYLSIITIDLYVSFLHNLEFDTAKSRLVFLILIIIALVMFIVLIVLIFVWPSVPAYMFQPECISRPCLEASRDIISWSSQNESQCQATHRWACGGFIAEHQADAMFGNFPGEWSADNYYKFEGE